MKNQLIFKHKIILLAITVWLLAAGFEAFFDGFASFEGSYKVYLVVLGASSLLIIYIIPFAFGISCLMRRYQINPSVIVLAAVCGLFIPTLLAGEANSFLYDWLQSATGETFANNWGDALTAPFVEESLKGLTVLLVIAMLPKNSLKAKLIVALVVGMSFQVAEDFTYIYSDGFQNINAAFPTAISRISGGLASHWNYTALFGVGLYLLFTNSKIFSQKQVFAWLITPVLIHFLWNSPLTSDLVGSSVLLNSIILLLFVQLYYKVDQLDEKT